MTGSNTLMRLNVMRGSRNRGSDDKLNFPVRSRLGKGQNL